MTKAFGTNPMERGLANESEQVNELQQPKHVKVIDYRGDPWHLRKDLVRNKTHPNYSKPDNSSGLSVLSTLSGWHNQRTGEVHEGSMRVGLGGTASPDSDYSPRFHISHYHTKG